MRTTRKERRVRTNKEQSHCSQGRSRAALRTKKLVRLFGIVTFMASQGTASANLAFDSDSVEIHVDNCASRCVTNSADDFVLPPQLVVGRVKGLGGQKVAVHAIGTIRWTLEDDEGASHSFMIPGTGRFRRIYKNLKGQESGSLQRITGRAKGCSKISRVGST